MPRTTLEIVLLQETTSNCLLTTIDLLIRKNYRTLWWDGTSEYGISMAIHKDAWNALWIWEYRWVSWSRDGQSMPSDLRCVHQSKLLSRGSNSLRKVQYGWPSRYDYSALQVLISGASQARPHFLGLKSIKAWYYSVNLLDLHRHACIHTWAASPNEVTLWLSTR